MVRVSSWQRFVVDGGIFVIAYVALDWVSFIHEFSPLGFTPWNPPPGLSLAFLVRTAPINAFWLPPAALLADLLVRGSPAPPTVALLSAAVLSIGYAGAAFVLRYRLGFDPALVRLRDISMLFALGMAAALIVAALYAGLFAAADLLAWSDVPPAAFRHWVGDVIGIAVVTPLLLRFPRAAGSQAKAAKPSGGELALQVATIPLVLWVVFGLPQTDEFKFFYLLFLPTIWISVRHGLDGAVLAIAGTQLGLILAIQLHHYGAETVVEFQMLMLALAFTGLLIGVVVDERQRIQDALHESETRLRERQSELAQFARVSVVGEMASSLAHELSQPLSATATYLSACRRLLNLPHVEIERIRQAIAKAEIQAQRAGHVLAGLRDFLYRGETHLTPIEIATLLDSVQALARPEAERLSVDIALRNPALGARVLIDRIQIEQALLNLVRNAIEAMSETSLPQHRLDIAATVRGSTVDIDIADTGPGVPAEIAAEVFQPFVTTKARGMGLGLTISRSIIEAHGGRLSFEPRPGGGSIFRISLPRTDE